MTQGRAVEPVLVHLPEQFAFMFDGLAQHEEVSADGIERDVLRVLSRASDTRAEQLVAGRAPR